MEYAVSYGDDADKAMEVIKGVLNREPFVLREPKPDVFATWGRDALEDKGGLERNGVEIPFPQRFANELNVRS